MEPFHSRPGPSPCSEPVVDAAAAAGGVHDEVGGPNGLAIGAGVPDRRDAPMVVHQASGAARGRPHVRQQQGPLAYRAFEQGTRAAEGIHMGVPVCWTPSTYDALRIRAWQYRCAGPGLPHGPREPAFQLPEAVCHQRVYLCPPRYPAARRSADVVSLGFGIDDDTLGVVREDPCGEQPPDPGTQYIIGTCATLRRLNTAVGAHAPPGRCGSLQDTYYGRCPRQSHMYHRGLDRRGGRALLTRSGIRTGPRRRSAAPLPGCCRADAGKCAVWTAT